MSALDEYRKYNEYLAAHPTAELEARRYIDLADAAIAELDEEVKVAKKLHADKCDQHMEEHTARLRAEAENERLLTRYACDVICGMGRRGNGSCSNPYDAECPALPDFIAAAKEEPC